MEITLGLVRDIIEETGRRGVKVNRDITRKYFREPSFNLKIFFCYLYFFFQPNVSWQLILSQERFLDG